MDKNTNRWAYRSFNPRMAEAFQRIAFTFGYKWPSAGVEGQQVRFTNATFFAVDPDRKELTYGNNLKDTSDHVSDIVSDLDSAMDRFTNPPVRNVRVGLEHIVFRDGSVKSYGGTISPETFDKLVEARNKLLGKTPKQKLPWVQFIYTSQNSGRKMRNILVVESGNGLLKGLDKDDDYAFKQYKAEKITGAVAFVGFEDEPS